MRHIQTLFLFILLLVFSGCEGYQDSLISADSKKIATVQEQLDAIEASLPKLKSTLKSLKSLTSESQSKGVLPITKAVSDEDVSNMDAYIDVLEERIELIEAYLYGDQSGDWTESTYSTIEMYEETIEILACIQCQVEAMKGTLEATKEQILKDVSTSINECFSSMKSWINEQLSGYYDIAATDAMLAKLQESLTAEDEAVRKEVESLRKDLADQMDEMRKDYKSAIKSAIEENNGVLNAKLEKAIIEVNARVDDAIEGMNKRMKDIEERLTKLENTVEALVNRIQSIAYIPIYDDEKARVKFPNADTSEGRLTLDFKISPKNTLSDLVNKARESKVVTVQAMYTGSVKAIDLPMVECSADESQGVFTITVACDNLDMDFYNGDKSARAIMYISDGNNDKNSEYIPLTPDLTHVAYNQIWYTVTGKTPVEIATESDSKILSHSYDQAKGCYVITFESGIRTIPSAYFAGKSEVKTVFLPNSIRRIENSAFEGCRNLCEISFGDSVESIGSKAFKDCALRQVTLPESLYTIGSEAFDYIEIKSFTGGLVADDGLTLTVNNTIKAVALGGIVGGKYSMPAGVTSVEADVFKNCRNINEVNCHDITEWCNIDFANQYSTPLHNGALLMINGDEVKDISFAETATQVKPYAFYGCNSLTCITLHDNIKKVGAGAFANCANLTSVTLQAITAPTFEFSVFDGCGKLDITIPHCEEAVTTYLASGWSNDVIYQIPYLLDPANLPAGYWVEYTTTDGQSVEFKDTNIYYNYNSNGKWFALTRKPLSSFGGFSSGAGRILTCTLPESVSVIGSNAFNGCSNMKSFVIPDAVTAINASAFKGCSSLNGLVIPQNVEMIGASAFENCSSLESVVLPDKVSVINSSTFANCTALNSFEFSPNIKEIKKQAFSNCTSLTKVRFLGNTPPVMDIDAFGDALTHIDIPESAEWEYIGCDWDIKYKRLLQFNDYPESHIMRYKTTDAKPVEVNQTAESYILKNVYERGEGVLVFTKPVVNVPNRLFFHCYNVKEVTFPSVVEKIGDLAFLRCDALKEVVLPDGVTEIGRSAFASSGLQTISLGNALKKIGDEAFSGCDELISVNLPDGLTEIGAQAFDRCNGLTSIDLPNSLTAIGSKAFWQCRNLKSITLPNSLTSIGSEAFSSAGITELNILKGITNIGEEAFKYCRELKQVYIPSSVKAIGYNAFHSCSTLNGLYIDDFESWLKIDMSMSSHPFAYTSSTKTKMYLKGELMEDIVIPGTIEHISNCAFYKVASIKTIFIPSSVKSLGEYLFSYIPDVQVKFESTTPPEIIDNTTFDNFQGKILVPSSAVENYKQQGWGEVIGY